MFDFLRFESAKTPESPRHPVAECRFQKLLEAFLFPRGVSRETALDHKNPSSFSTRSEAAPS